MNKFNELYESTISESSLPKLPNTGDEKAFANWLKAFGKMDTYQIAAEDMITDTITKASNYVAIFSDGDPDVYLSGHGYVYVDGNKDGSARIVLSTHQDRIKYFDTLTDAKKYFTDITKIKIDDKMAKL